MLQYLGQMNQKSASECIDREGDFEMGEQQRNSAIYYQKGLELLYEGDVEASLLNISKSIYLKPTPMYYIQRAQLFAAQQKYKSSVIDYQQAVNCFGSQQEPLSPDQTPESLKTKQFIKQDICIQNLGQIKAAVDIYEKTSKYIVKQQNETYQKLLANLLHANQALQHKLEEYTQNIQLKLKNQQNQQQQVKKLLELKDRRIAYLQKTLQEKMAEQPKNYQSVFYKEIDESTISLNNKEKCQIYFRTVIFQMERYYLAAKVLGDFSTTQKIKFEDYGIGEVEEQTQKKTSKNKPIMSKQIIQKIFKMFDKNSKSIDKVTDLVKELPYIGTAFKILKSLVKGFGWVDKIKVENQCENILNIRTTISSFNQFSFFMAYHLYRNYRMKITMASKINRKKNVWQQMTYKYKYLRKKVVNTYVNVEEKQLECVKDMAELHVAVLMVGVAYKVFVFPPFQFPDQEKLQEIYKAIDAIDEKLLCQDQNSEQMKQESLNSLHLQQQPQIQDNKPEQKQEPNKKQDTSNQSKCSIF